MYLLLIGGTAVVGVGSLVYRNLTLASSKKRKRSLIPTYTFFLKDKDIDNVNSVLSQLVSSHDDAFSKPTTFVQLVDAVPYDQVIHLVIHTNGGAAVAAEKMLRKLRAHPAGYIAYIKQSCYSAGTILALGANEIVMTRDSMLGKIDPQIGNKQMSIHAATPKDLISSDNVYDVHEGIYAMNYITELLDIIFGKEKKTTLRANIEKDMLHSPLPHYKAFTFEDCLGLGLPVRMANEQDLPLFEYDQQIVNYQ